MSYYGLKLASYFARQHLRYPHSVIIADPYGNHKFQTVVRFRAASSFFTTLSISRFQSAGNTVVLSQRG